MPDNPRFFLGYGERLTTRIAPPGGGGGSEPAYTFDEAVARLLPLVREAASEIAALPDSACPNGEAVGVITLHPQWIAKSYHPQQLLRAYNLRQIGSRPVQIQPERWTRQDEPSDSASSELYVAGPRDSFQRWAQDLSTHSTLISSDIRRLEKVRAPKPSDRMRNILNEGSENSEDILLEVVLHASDGELGQSILSGFATYAESLGVHPNFDRRLHAGGLCFLPVEAKVNAVEALTRFAFLRVARPMPRLRSLPTIERSISSPELSPSPFPIENAVDPDLRIAIFDGGLDPASPLIRWTVPYNGQGIGPETAPFLSHGHDVTSAVLFGSLVPGEPAPRPYAVVDHYRVIDQESVGDPYELYEVLARVDDVLRTHPYEFFNLSIGPALPIEDDEVHPWTALLDTHLSDGKSLATMAVGNTGRANRELGEARIQPPSDCVNGLSVGSADTKHIDWKRAPYSSFGPGRSPGVVKPDIVQFGGDEVEPFVVYDAVTAPALAGTRGTSFSAPAVLRLASGIRAHFGSRITPLALKALLVHSADPLHHHRDEVGWGRVSNDVAPIAVCEDGMVRVVYQGELTPSQYLQAIIPTPVAQLVGNVNIKATFCYATRTDPEDPGTYTQSGLEVTFRPHAERFAEDATVPNTMAFFKRGDFETERALRADAQKWETTLNAQRTLRANSLLNPVFDIHYNARESGGAARNADPIRYALVVTVRANRVPDLYDQVVRAFAGVLEPLLPIVEIPIRT